LNANLDSTANVCVTAYSKGSVVGLDNLIGQHFFLFILLLFMFRVVHVPVLFSLCSLVRSSNVEGGVHAAVGLNCLWKALQAFLKGQILLPPILDEYQHAFVALIDGPEEICCLETETAQRYISKTEIVQVEIFSARLLKAW